MKVEQIDLDGIREVPPQDASRLVHEGKVLIVRQGLQQIGWLEPLIELSFTELASIIGQERADRVRAEGFPSLHKHLSPEELFAFNEATMEKLLPLAPRMLKRVATKLLGLKTAYVEKLPNARTFVPYDYTLEHMAAFKKVQAKRGPGKVTEHGPHHDSWFEHPLNTVNVWSAITPVHDGNGMVVWPHKFGKRLPYAKNGAVRGDQYYGRPINFELGVGDIVLFMGEHLHGSELNRTTQTRYVISMRMTEKAPNFHGSTYSYRYLHSALVDTPFEKLAELPIVIRPGYAMSRLKLAARALRGQTYWKGQPEIRNVPPLDDLSGEFPPDLNVDTTSDGSISFQSDELGPGEIRAVNATTCAARMMDGTVVAFGRKCPHEGADMAAGYVREDGKVMCPWHNLSFDPTTGTSTCGKLAKLRVRSVHEEDGKVVITGNKAVEFVSTSAETTVD